VVQAAADSGSIAGLPALFGRLLDQLRTDAVPHAVLRDSAPGEVPAELDLLVWPEARERFARAAAACGFVRWRRRLPKKDVFAAYESGQLLLADVHYAFVQQGLVYLPLRDPPPPGEGEVPRLLPEDELLHLCFHGLIGKGGIQPKRLPRVRELIATRGEEGALRRRLADERLWTAIEPVLIDPDAHVVGTPAATAVARRVRALLRRSPGNRWRNLLFRWAPRLRRRRGLLVVFMGVDGAGKTTTIEEVTRRLEAIDAVPFVNTYMGPWGQFRTRLLTWTYARGLTPPEQDWWREMTARLRGTGGQHGVLHCAAKWLRGQIRSAFYYFAVWWDLWARYLGSIRPRLRRGVLVLADRYVHDLRYLFHDRPATVAPLWRRLVCFLFPRPHLVVFLFNDPETIVARKPQLDEERIRSFQEAYRRVVRTLPHLEMKTDRPVPEIADAVTAHILARYYERR